MSEIPGDVGQAAEGSDVCAEVCGARGATEARRWSGKLARGAGEVLAASAGRDPSAGGLPVAEGGVVDDELTVEGECACAVHLHALVSGWDVRVRVLADCIEVEASRGGREVGEVLGARPGALGHWLASLHPAGPHAGPRPVG